MATETVVTTEHVEGKENQELKTIEKEIVSSSQAEELASLKAPITESEEKTEDENLQPAVLEAEKVGVAPGLDVPAGERSAPTEDSKPNDLSVLDPVVKDVEKKTEGQSVISDVTDTAAESVEKTLESPTQELGPEVETKLEEVSEESKIVKKPESIAEESEVEKEPEVKKAESVSAVEEPEIGKQIELESKAVELPESAVKVEEKPVEKSVNVEIEKKSDEKLEPKEVKDGDSTKAEEASINKVDEAIDSTPMNDTSKDQEPVANASSVFDTPGLVDQGESVNPDGSDTVHDDAKKEESISQTPGPVDQGLSVIPDVTAHDDAQKEESISETPGPVDQGVSVIPDVTANGDAQKEESFSETPSPVEQGISVIPDVMAHDDAQKEESGADVGEESAKEASLKVIMAEEEKLVKHVKEDESTIPETTTTEEVVDSKPATDITEKLVQEEKASRGVETVTGEKQEENVNNEIAASVETIKDAAPLNIETEKGDAPTSTTDIAEKSIEGQEICKDVEMISEQKKTEDGKIDGVASVEITNDTEHQSTTKTEGEDDLNSAAGVAEKIFEGAEASKDLDVATEENKEDVKDITTSSLETVKDKDLDGKVEVVDTANTPVPEPKQLELEPQAKDLAETNVDNLAKETEVVEETLQSDAPTLESSKGPDEAKTKEDPPKQEVPKKHSNGIISKMKHSIVKVKKAIIGKSPSSKTIISDAKDDIKVK